MYSVGERGEPVRPLVVASVTSCRLILRELDQTLLEPAHLEITVPGQRLFLDGNSARRSRTYESVAAARAGLGRYFRFYKAERRHQGLGCRTPDAVYADSDSWPKAA